MTKNERIENLKEIARYGTSLTVEIPETVFYEKTTSDKFKKVQKAYKELKKDPKLNITEKNKIEKINDTCEVYPYKIITINTKKRE